MLPALCVGLCTTCALAVPLRVRGSVVIQARATPVDGGLDVRGSLADESNRPFADGRLVLRLLSSRGGPAERLPPPSTCTPTLSHHVRYAPARAGVPASYTVRTDAAGSFCVRIPGKAVSGTIRLRFPGNDYFAAAESEFDVDSSRHGVALRFSPRPRILSLERPRHLIGVETSVEPDSGTDEGEPDIQLVLKLEPRGGPARELSTCSVRVGDRALFAIDSSSLGGVGPARLTVVFAGSPTLQPARLSTIVQRTAVVTLSAAGRVEPSNRRGAEVRVRVRSRLGAVPGGSVEARLGDESVGTAPVVAGTARVVAVFDAPRDKQIVLTLRYLPDAPWWLAGAPVEIAIPLAPPSPWRRLPWVLAAIAIALWVTRGWRRPARRESTPRTDPTRPPGRPALDLVERGPTRSGWRGHVRDAHEGTPIAGARVLVRVPTFGSDGVAAEAVTGESGQFTLEPLDAAPVEGATLEASARWHATLIEPLVPSGHVAIALVSRRRALLDQLVGWARRRGPPWSGRDEPTPGHVAGIARARSADEIARWADGVQQAAFGPTPPDEETERRLGAREPRGEDKTR